MLNKKKILIVDDEVQNLRILIEILKENYSIIVAKDGNTALEMAVKEPCPDIILLDIVMPGMNGFEVLTGLKDTVITKNIPVIFLSANEDAETIEKANSLDSSGFLTKPVEPDILNSLIKDILKI